MDTLEAISPIDGRYHHHTKRLSDYFSEKALISYRVKVEGEYLIALSEHPEIAIKSFTDEEKNVIRLFGELFLYEARLVKQIETQGYGKIQPTNHDMKAVEYFMKDQLNMAGLHGALEWVHFGLTSEDVNNISYSLMLRDGLNDVILPKANRLVEKINELAEQYKAVPILARTHGQSASPTTFGKEFRVYASRLERQLSILEKQKIQVKLNGATGNYNAQIAAYPNVDWVKFTNDFVQISNHKGAIELEANLLTTQIESHDSYIELFDGLKRFNTILLDFNQDMWRYISDNWLTLKPVVGEIGSSTMPHKVNPIDFESSEGNLGMANAMFNFFGQKLPISRLQRDLSDSTVQRNFGVALGHCLVGYSATHKGLTKIAVNEAQVIEALENNPQVISEAMQTVLRREGVKMPYEKLKDLTRGKRVTLEELYTFVDTLNIPDTTKEELKQITPLNYIGLAKELCDL